MKKISLLLFIIVSCVLLQAQELPLWLKGLWTISQEETQFPVFEEWKQVEDEAVLSSKTFRLFGKDTLFFDTKKIYVKDSKVVLQMKVLKDGINIDYCYEGEEIEKEVWRFSASDNVVPAAIFYRRFNENSVAMWTETSSSDESCIEVFMYR